MPVETAEPALQRPRPGLDRILGAGSIAVVGASDRRGLQRALIDNAIATSATAWGVHPTRAEVRGLPCWPSCADLPEQPDVAILLVGHRYLLAAAEDAIAAGAGALVVPGLGPEAGAEGAAVAAELGKLAAAADVPVVGHNCMGVAIPGTLPAWVGTLGRDLLPGRVAAVVQSGSVGEALCALGPRVGFRCIVSLGSELTHDVADWCAELAADEGTDAVGLFLESVRRPRALREALELLGEAGKPVACLRVGKSAAGARATIAHTDAVLTPARSFAALARAANLIEVDDFSELVETLELLGRCRPRGTRIAAVTQSGGEAALLGDLTEAAGAPLREFSPELRAELSAELPDGVTVQNPLDAWTIDDPAGVYRRVFEAIARSDEYDALVLQIDQSPYVGELERGVAEAVAGALAEATRDVPGGAVPVLLSMNASEPTEVLRDVATTARVPLLRGSAAAIRALVRVARWSPPDRGRPVPATSAPIELGGAGLDEVESADLLRAHGVRYSSHYRARDPDEAVESARALGYPVVVKADEHGHRSAASRVALGLASDAEVRAAAVRIGGRLIVARQIPSAPELYCGGSSEGGYGPTICVGWGGHHVEQARFVACALAPVDVRGARELLDDVPGMTEACGEGMIDEVAAAVAAISQIVAALPSGASIDVNPILVSKQHGPVAVDALVAQPQAAKGRAGGG
jgi:acyl-CoA synthetase (NDP forming)